MAKPDIVKALVMNDGSVLRDTGRGFTTLAIKGATSEELKSKILTADTHQERS